MRTCAFLGWGGVLLVLTTPLAFASEEGNGENGEEAVAENEVKFPLQEAIDERICEIDHQLKSLRKLRDTIASVEQAKCDWQEAQENLEKAKDELIEVASKLKLRRQDPEDQDTADLERSFKQLQREWHLAELGLRSEELTLDDFLERLEKFKKDSPEVLGESADTLQEYIEEIRELLGVEKKDEVDTECQPEAETRAEGDVEPDPNETSGTSGHRDPFIFRPLVSRVTEARSLTDFDSATRRTSEGDRRGEFAMEHHFPQAARFPLPAWGIQGTPRELPGVLIYEGMRFAIRNDGSYQVRFTAGAPAVPVTMQLQFQLKSKVNNEQDSRIHHVTLPPITITPERERTTRDDPGPHITVQGDIYIVHHEGHLNGLYEFLSKSNKSPRLSEIHVAHRSGTARFGYGTSPP